ncbi:MAG: ATP-grasp domain-containing protein [Clostridiales bacterium]|nr:ATP-grasp domain-containing protein [Clostridiales bacterium]
MEKRFNEKTAVVLGGTAPHAELIRRLKNRGYYTILVDYLDHPPAKAEADLHLQESTLDQEAVLRLAKEYHADTVICSCIDQANITACYVNEQLGLHAPYSYETAKKITNKGYMKKVMRENAIPTSDYVYVDEWNQDRQIHLSFPVMVKPADSNTSNGVKRADTQEELERYLDEAIAISRNHRAVAEGYVDGREISAYFYISKKKAHLLLTNERFSRVEGENQVIRCYSIVYPARMSEKAKAGAERIADQIAQAFQLDNTPLFFQGILNGDTIQVLKFAPRIGGGLSYRAIEEHTGFDILSASIDSWLGNEVCVKIEEKEQITVTNVVYAKSGILGKITGTEEQIAEGQMEDYVPYKTEGTEIDDHFNSSSRVGAFTVKGKAMPEVLRKIREIYEKIDVLDVSGRSILRKDLYLGSEADIKL